MSQLEVENESKGRFFKFLQPQQDTFQWIPMISIGNKSTCFKSLEFLRCDHSCPDGRWHVLMVRSNQWHARLHPCAADAGAAICKWGVREQGCEGKATIRSFWIWTRLMLLDITSIYLNASFSPSRSFSPAATDFPSPGMAGKRCSFVWTNRLSA